VPKKEAIEEGQKHFLQTTERPSGILEITKIVKLGVIGESLTKKSGNGKSVGARVGSPRVVFGETEGAIEKSGRAEMNRI